MRSKLAIVPHSSTPPTFLAVVVIRLPEAEFATLPPAAAADILGALRPRRLRRHQYLIQEGSAVPDDYFVEVSEVVVAE